MTGMDRSVFRNVEANLKKGIRQQITVDAGGETYTRQFVPYQRLILLGGGHVSQALCNFAAELDFERAAELRDRIIEIKKSMLEE